ncbi:carboxylating nicotinate-nucleotide diphosphorylase [Caryophanon latum]|uniref:Probable nicotinate-nucleotide pyrophosphorylase [carboxylating] n=1 Tax=Caryophanon latum TaxID=33977 RepID=A0A1C0Z0X2_9BACL|nr:carboxylating nicotinate-nucleotide diphosphorylase [Caryophanon latum]OCS93053.1 nicotinate-nucleotide diphosphorylase (carboxylating) [Caryophanon latum]
MNQLKLKEMLTRFFHEDIGDGDLSSELIFPESEQGTYTLYAKEDGIFCGALIIQRGFLTYDPSLQVELLKKDGDTLTNGEPIAHVHGAVRSLLTAERVVLNLVQRLSAIATITHHAVEQTKGTSTRICDTRKTMPGLRMLDKYAVRVGGAFNHRSGLYDAVMLKDNHIAFAGSITDAVQHVKESIGHTVKVEVEIESKEQLIEAIAANVDIIMFDNCTPAQIKEWLPLVPAHITTEASGGITIDTIADFAQSGVQWISLGQLTHSVHAFDISARVYLKGAVTK